MTTHRRSPKSKSDEPASEPVDSYPPDAQVCVTGDADPGPGEFPPIADVYVTQNRTWADGDQIVDVSGGAERVVGGVIGGEFFDVGAWTPPLTPGSYDLVLDEDQDRVFDAADDTVSEPTATFGFQVSGGDSRPPITTIDSGPSGATRDRTPPFEFSADEPATFECSIDSDTAFEPCASPYTTATLTLADYTFRARATDAAHNTGDAAARAFSVVANRAPQPADDATDGRCARQRPRPRR